MSTPKTNRQPLSDKRKLIIIITAIILAAVIAVSVTLIILLQPQDVNPDVNDPSNSTSSNLPVKNGDFGLVGSEDTRFPKSATNWTRYGYKAPNGSSHDFEVLESPDDVVMGIVDTNEDTWQTVKDDLAWDDVTLGDNPRQHHFLSENEKHSNSNVYMIAAKNLTAAAIISDSVSVPATTSVKFTIRYNSSQVTEGNAVIMIQKHASTPDAKEENRYAYDYNITTKNDWNEVELYVFNRKTSTQYVRVSVGLGNVYTGDKADGILFVDDIVYETVTANDYRLKADIADKNDTTYKIIEKEEETTVPEISKYLGLKDYNTEGTTAKTPDYTRSLDNGSEKGYVSSTITADDSKGYSPFTDKDDFFKLNSEGEQEATGFGIYKITNYGVTKAPVALELATVISLQLDENNYQKQDYNHISFWIRTVTKDDNALAYANIVVKQRESSADDWTTLSGGDFTVKTEQDYKTDTNNGWSKYDIYLKPAKSTTEINIVFALGSILGYDGTDYKPNGELYVTTPYFETISSSAYSNASSSTASKKFDLAGSTADTSVTNGSFSLISANTNQPTGWTPVFAGDNAIYRDGKGNDRKDTLTYTKAAVEGSGLVNWKDEFTTDPDNKYVDDDEGRVLKLVSNATTSYGYISNEINASAHTVYAFSVLVKMGNKAVAPYFYLLESNVDRSEAVLASVVNKYSSGTVDNSVFCQTDVYEKSGWIRYYIVYVTGDSSKTVKLALFNGSIDGNTAVEAGTTIYYDKVTMQTLGTYSMVEDEENKDATEYVVKFNANSDFADTAIAKCEDVDQLIAKMEETLDTNKGTSISKPGDDEWTEMKKIPEPDDGEDDEPTETPAEKQDVNLGLLFSILSSVLLVAALAVVVVIKIYKQRKRNA